METLYDKINVPVKYVDIFIGLCVAAIVVCVILGMLKGRGIILSLIHIFIRIYVLASVMYALGGFLLGAKAGGASTATGFGYELEAIAACTIGGVSTNGGVGKVSGVLIGVMVFEVLKICLQFMGVDPAYTFIVQGLVIIVAVALDPVSYTHLISRRPSSAAR